MNPRVSLEKSDSDTRLLTINRRYYIIISSLYPISHERDGGRERTHTHTTTEESNNNTKSSDRVKKRLTNAANKLRYYCRHYKGFVGGSDG